MASLNRVLLIGNLTKGPELRYTPKGSAVCDVSLSVNRSWKDDAGNKQEEVTYVDVVLWGRLAELAGQYLAKGRPVFIEGRLQQESWDDKTTGQKRTRMKVVGESMQFLGSKPREDEPPAENRDHSTARAAPRGTQPDPGRGGPPSARRTISQEAGDLEEDDIPF